MYSTRRIQWTAALFALVIIVAAMAFGGREWGQSALAGSAIVLGSFILWRCIARFIVEKRGPTFLVFLAGFAKLLIVGWALWYTVTKTTIEPLAFLAGLSCIVASIFLEGVRSLTAKG